MSRILVLGRLRRVDHKFEVTLGYTGERERICQTKGSTGDSIYKVSEGGRSR